MSARDVVHLIHNGIATALAHLTNWLDMLDAPYPMGAPPPGRKYPWSVQQQQQSDKPEPEYYSRRLHRMLAWDEPRTTFILMSMFYALFGLFLLFEATFYSTLSMLLLYFIVADYGIGLSCELHPPRTPDSDNLQLLHEITAQGYLTLQYVRKENSVLFAIFVVSFFTILMAIGRSCSSGGLVHLATFAIFGVPYLLSTAPRNYLIAINEAIRSFATYDGTLAETELIPFISHKHLIENDPDADSLVNSEDSLTSSLISGITSMPSYWEAEGSVDGLEEDELELPLHTAKKSAVTFSSGESSDSDSENKQLKFEPAHFPPDSSSDDETHFTKGLQFAEANQDSIDAPIQPETTTVDGTLAERGAGIMQNLTNLGSNLLTALKTAEAPKRSDSSSDSDFEIINYEEANDSL